MESRQVELQCGDIYNIKIYNLNVILYNYLNLLTGILISRGLTI